MTRRLISNERGSAIIEIAVALPALIVLMWAIVQAGLVFRAMSGIQHGLGEGARYATLYPTPTTSTIKSKIQSTVYGIGPGSFTISNPVSGTQDGGNYLDLQVSYTQSTNLLIIPGPTITVSRSKRVWISTA
ncbi:MAG: pilus assembly protein [Pseudomonadota bacterium]|nr:pilus assembly protein [Pseudomonadota bacterium]